MDRSVEIESPVWWRRVGFARALLTGLPILAIGAIIITFWVLSLIRADEYKFLPVGSTAPQFSLVTAAGEQISGDERLGRRPFLMYFNEGVG